jgi:DNA-binding PadR family transcriptional regulator
MFEDRHGHGDRRHARGGFGFGFGGGRLGGHHRSGRHRGVFDHGDLRYVLLQLIAEKPRHGYELIKAIEEKFGGMYSPSPGVIYPTLTLLEELGYLSAEAAGGTKKLYSLTEEGVNFLAANRVTVEAVSGRMAEASRTYGAGPAPEIRRAMHNLELALSLRLSKGRLDETQLRTITAALDRAASDIERS